jgi:hypothetical protein
MLIFKRSDHLEMIGYSNSDSTEFVACFEATFHLLWLRNFILGLGVVDTNAKSLRIYCDNSAFIFFSKKDKYSKDAISI